MQQECHKKFRATVEQVENRLERDMIRTANIDMEASYSRDREYTHRCRKTMESALAKLKEEYRRLKETYFF